MATLILTDSELATLANKVAKLQDPAKLLYRTDFSGVALAPITAFWDTGAMQDLLGTPVEALWGGKARLLLSTDPLKIASPTDVAPVMSFVIDPKGGRNGPGLFQTIAKSVNDTKPMGGAVTQSAVYFLPQHEEPTLYTSLWLKLQPDLVQRLDDSLVPGSWAWRVLTEFKTGTLLPGHPGDDGDMRVQFAIRETEKGKPFFTLIGDNQAGGYSERIEYFYLESHTPVPIDWFHVEQFWRRSSDPFGRVVIAINGTKVFDRWGANVGEQHLPINRLYLPVLYSSSSYPIYQSVDEIELWDLPPKIASFTAG